MRQKIAKGLQSDAIAIRQLCQLGIDLRLRNCDVLPSRFLKLQALVDHCPQDLTCDSIAHVWRIG
jgi:hypothetical protein